MTLARGGTCPWAPCALVDRSAANGGWSVANYRLTLVGWAYGEEGTDSKDGSAFAAGDKVAIVETAPDNANAPLYWGPLTVASAFGTDGANVLTLSAVTLGAWDATREYAVIAAHHRHAATSQRRLGTWQADADTHLLDTGDEPQRLG